MILLCAAGYPLATLPSNSAPCHSRATDLCGYSTSPALGVDGADGALIGGDATIALCSARGSHGIDRDASPYIGNLILRLGRPLSKATSTARRHIAIV